MGTFCNYKKHVSLRHRKLDALTLLVSHSQLLAKRPFLLLPQDFGTLYLLTFCIVASIQNVRCKLKIFLFNLSSLSISILWIAFSDFIMIIIIQNFRCKLKIFLFNLSSLSISILWIAFSDFIMIIIISQAANFYCHSNVQCCGDQGYFFLNPEYRLSRAFY
jgi:hypothetical protein